VGLFVRVARRSSTRNQEGVSSADIKPSICLVTPSLEGGPAPPAHGVDFGGLAKATMDHRLRPTKRFSLPSDAYWHTCLYEPRSSAAQYRGVDTRHGLYSAWG